MTSWSAILVNKRFRLSCVAWSSEAHNKFRTSLAEVKDMCAKDEDCPAVVDFSGNQGRFAVCKSDTKFRDWQKVCVEKKGKEEL